MTKIQTFISIALCACSLSALVASVSVAAPNAHANDHATSNTGNANGNGGGNQSNGNGSAGATPHAVVHQYALANGLSQGELARTLKSWNSLNANPKAFLNNLNNPDSLLGKEAQYICANAASQVALTGFTSLGGDPANPPTAQQMQDAQAYLGAVTLLGGADPATVASDPTSTPEQVAAADLVLGSAFDPVGAQALIDQYNAWTAYQSAAGQADATFVTASVSYHGSDAGALSQLRTTVDGVVAQKGLDTGSLCGTQVASAQ